MSWCWTRETTHNQLGSKKKMAGVSPAVELLQRHFRARGRWCRVGTRCVPVSVPSCWGFQSGRQLPVWLLGWHAGCLPFSVKCARLWGVPGGWAVARLVLSWHEGCPRLDAKRAFVWGFPSGGQLPVWGLELGLAGCPRVWPSGTVMGVRGGSPAAAMRPAGARLLGGLVGESHTFLQHPWHCGWTPRWARCLGTKN